MKYSSKLMRYNSVIAVLSTVDPSVDLASAFTNSGSSIPVAFSKPMNPVPEKNLDGQLQDLPDDYPLPDLAGFLYGPSIPLTYSLSANPISVPNPRDARVNHLLPNHQNNPHPNRYDERTSMFYNAMLGGNPDVDESTNNKKEQAESPVPDHAKKDHQTIDDDDTVEKAREEFYYGCIPFLM